MKNRREEKGEEGRNKIITMFGDVKKKATGRQRLLSSGSSLLLDDSGGLVSHAGTETYGHGGGDGGQFLAVGKVSPSRAKIMGIPIRVKETAAVSTYLDARTRS